MNVLDGYIAKEQGNVEYLNEEIGNAFMERSEVVMALREASARLGALYQLKHRIEAAKKLKQRKYGHEPTPDCNGELKASMAGAKPLDEKAKTYFAAIDNNCDAQASFLARSMK